MISEGYKLVHSRGMLDRQGYIWPYVGYVEAQFLGILEHIRFLAFRSVCSFYIPLSFFRLIQGHNYLPFSVALNFY